MKKGAVFLVFGIIFCLTAMVRTTFAEEDSSISKVDLSDLQGIREDIVINQLAFKAGEQIDAEKLSLSELRLKKLGIFKDGSVAIVTEPDDNNGVKISIVGEPMKQGIDFGFSFNKAYNDKVNFKPEQEAEAAQGLSGLSANMDYHNVAGSGVSLSAKYAFLYERWWNIAFTAPTVFETPTKLTGAWGRKEIDWELSRGKYAGSTYHASTRELNIGLQHVFSSKTVGNIVLGYRDNRISNANLANDLSGEDRKYIFVSPSVTWSNFDDPEEPSTGTIINTGVVVGKGTEDDGKSFTRVDFDIEHFLPIGEKHEFYVRSLLGAATDDTPLTLQKFLGGKEILRAHKAEIYGVNYLASSLEYRRNFLFGFQAFGFVDVGRTWDAGEKVNFKDFVTDVGLGARFKIPNDIEFSCTYGHNFDEKKGRIYFNTTKAF